jgi:precorrin-3B synthase
MSGRRVRPAAPTRRGWCPGLARPMPTGDGLLARIHPPLGLLDPAQMRAVAEAARAFGNGHLDVTARANLQIRGVRPETQGSLAEALTAIGLGDSRGDGGPQRLTLTSPHCGLDAGALIDGHAVAARIEALGRAVAPLPAKTLVAVEAGGACDLAGIEADIHIQAREPGRAAIGLATGADPVWLGTWPEDAIPDASADLLRAFARTGARRMRDLTDAERAALPAPTELGPARDPLPPPSDLGPARDPHPPSQVGQARLGMGDGGQRQPFAILAVDAPFGRCTADMLDRLADAADGAGASEIRLSPSRGFVLAVDPARAEAARARLAAAFVTDPEDPRRAVAACPGAPACASGSTPTLRDAARLAEAFRPFAAQGLTAHLSGCAKGCAEPRRSALTLVAANGLYGAVPGGAAGDPPVEWLTIEAALERVRGAQTANLEDLFRTKP